MPTSKFNRDIYWNISSLALLGFSGIIINILIFAWQGSEALGIFNQVFSFYIVISQVAVGGLQLSVLKHCSYSQDDYNECSVIVSSALILVATVSFFICLILFLMADTIGIFLQSHPVATGIKFVVPGLFVFSLNKVLLMTINGLRNMRAFAVFQSLRYLLIMISIVFIMLRGYPGSHLSLSLSIAELVLFVVLVLYINFKLFHFRFSLSPEIFKWFSRHVSFGSRGFLSGILTEMNTRVDVLMLGYFLTDRVVGIYSLALIFAEGFSQLSMVVRQNIDPIIGKCFSEDNKDKIQEITYKIRKTFYPAMILSGLLLIILFPTILVITKMGKGFGDCWGVFSLLVFGIVLTSGYKPLISILLQGGRPGAFTIMMFLTVTVNAIMNSLLIPLIGIYGAALATVSAYIFEVLINIILSKKLLSIRL